MRRIVIEEQDAWPIYIYLAVRDADDLETVVASPVR